jgi:hypothetical protein
MSEHASTQSATDRSFDRLLPDELRHLSQTHWTPVEVAIRVTALLAPTSRMRILDVGSGIGKLCVVGAMASPATWCGVECHRPFVEAARRLAATLNISSRTMFIHADAFAIDWRDFDAIYLYNPFEEPLFSCPAEGSIAQTERRLAELHPGTRVVTLHGFGGEMPPSFELLYQERLPAVRLELAMWIKRSNARRSRS